MYYKVKVSDRIRVPPSLFGEDLMTAIVKQIKEKYEGMIDKDLGVVIDVSEVHDVGEGVVIPGDGASYFETCFDLIVFRPEMQEVIEGKIKDIADFGVFMGIGPIEGMIHISQTMDDFVNFSKDKVLAGKESKHVLKVNDKCRARIIAVSFKDIQNPKIGMTMRQSYLGKLEWIDEEVAKADSGDEKSKTQKKAKQ